MAASNPPVKNTAFTIRVPLEDFSTPGAFKSSPTIAAGDFKVDIDGAGFNNLGTLPSVSPAAGTAVLITLSASEMNGDLITVTCIDQTSPKEWSDAMLEIQTVAAVWLAPATAGRNLVVDAAGLADANVVKVGPTGSGTAQTAGDIPARLPAALTANGNMKSSLLEIMATALTETSGQIAAAFKQFFDVASPTGTMKAITNVVTATNLTTNNDKTGYALTAGERTSIADAMLDETAGVETGLTVRQWLRIAAAALFGKASGLDTNAPKYRDQADTKNRISATTDASGNRTAVTLDSS